MWSVGVSWAGASQLPDGGKHHGDVVGREAGRQTDRQWRQRERKSTISLRVWPLVWPLVFGPARRFTRVYPKRLQCEAMDIHRGYFGE